MKDYRDWHPNFPVDLSNCQDEPIQIPGAIQAFGFLIGFDGHSCRIKAISENALMQIPELADFEKNELKTTDFFEIEDTAEASAFASTERNRWLVRVRIKKTGVVYHGIRFSVPGLEVLEIETVETVQKEGAELSYLGNLPLMLREIQGQKTTAELARFVAKKIKKLTGFDRVMIYQYDHDFNGEVIAEAKEERLETFLGLHYPASDIPAQARALYRKNWIRIIPTMEYKPFRILPKEYQSLDLSNSVLRSVSPIHIRYLKNMDVTASMSISLVIDGELWGLVACHHYSGEHYVPLEIRLGCEAYGQLVSWHIKTLEAGAALSAQVSGEQSLHKVLEVFGSTEILKEAADQAGRRLLELFDCTGIVIRLGDEVIKIGEDPGDIFYAAVAKALVDRTILEPLVTDEVQNFPPLRELPPNPEAAGMMALALSPKHNYYIVCVRQEERRSVNWAGDPRAKERKNFDDPSQRLHPRGSFALWVEEHEGVSKPWKPESVELLKKFGLLFVKIVIERKEIVERANNELKTLNQAKDEFVATVSHELRTPLNAIIGWTDLALSGELEEDKIPEALKIIQRNARSQNQLVADLLDVSRIISGKMKLSIRNMRLSEIAEAVVLSFTPAATTKSIQIISHLDDSADSIIGDPNRIQQVVWNILSNAVKFSPKDSKIWVKVRRVNSQMELTVQDQGVGLEPQDFARIFGRFQQVDSSASRKAGGLGLGLAISKHIVELHGGKIEVYSEGPGKGTMFRVYFPIAPVLPKEKNSDMPIDDLFEEGPHQAVENKILTGEVILIVEDEPDATQFLKLLIDSYGAKTFTAFNGKEALDVLSKHKSEIGIVLSDIGMPQMDGYQLIREIRASKDEQISSVCAVALTAFGRPQDRIQALKAGFDSYIAKPVMQDELITVLETVCKSRKR